MSIKPFPSFSVSAFRIHNMALLIIHTEFTHSFGFCLHKQHKHNMHISVHHWSIVRASSLCSVKHAVGKNQ